MDINSEISKDGYRIFSVNINEKKKYLGNKYNHGREIKKFIDRIGTTSEKDNYIIFGLFFGEHVKELLKSSSPKSHILIVEHNQKIIDFCKNDKEVKQILDDYRVDLAYRDIDIEEYFKKYINENNIANLRIEEYCSYYNLFKDYLYDKYEMIKKEITRITLNRNTILKTYDITFDNFLGNLKYLAKSTPINVLKDKYKDIPAIIVSAGPSLSKNIDYLKENRDALVFSGGRTLRTLLEKDIIPNCVASVDFSEVAFKLVEGYLNKINIPLVISENTNPKILGEHIGNKFFFSSNEFLGEIWEQKIKELFGGGSIAHTLTLLATYIGCNPIIFIGQDLAYTGDRGHDILTENAWQKLTFENFYKSDSDIYVNDIYGKPVRTSVQLNDYRLSLEKIINENPSITFINATEGGANIKGTINKTLKNVISEFQKTSTKQFDVYSENIDKSQEIIGKLKNTNKRIKQYIDMCQEGIKLVKIWKVNYNMKNGIKLKECEDKLRKLDIKFNSNLKEIAIINSMLTKVVLDIQNNERFIINTSDNLEMKLSKNISRINEVYSRMREIFEISYKKIDDTVKNLR
jgi:hypothetical protein